MTITFGLSTESINKAIRKLSNVADNLPYSVNDMVEVMAYKGAEEAQKAFGSMTRASMQPESMTSAKIVTPGNDDAVIAEFGAGYATMEGHPFAANAPVPIKVASYSQAQYPYGLFYITNDLYGPENGYWIFGEDRQVYQRIEPRHGLLNAYLYLMENSTRIAQEVMKL